MILKSRSSFDCHNQQPLGVMTEAEHLYNTILDNIFPCAAIVCINVKLDDVAMLVQNAQIGSVRSWQDQQSCRQISGYYDECAQESMQVSSLPGRYSIVVAQPG
jgi:hypothetical protein